jgi:hypothetical protein
MMKKIMLKREDKVRPMQIRKIKRKTKRRKNEISNF